MSNGSSVDEQLQAVLEDVAPQREWFSIKDPIRFRIASGLSDTMIRQGLVEAASYQVDGPGTYMVYASNRYGSGSGAVEVETEGPGCRLTLPNVFTPNGDGKNDRFRVRSENCGVKSLRIYNRWGQVIYKEENEAPSWSGRNPSGKKVPAGTYFYSIRIGEETHQGEVTLVRDGG